ncbi:MAG: PTS sugar transporter subunit IIA [Acidobacteriota bacterium]
MILEHLPPERLRLEGRARDKKGVLAELAELLATDRTVAFREQVLAGLLEREEVMSTGIGQGIAIPHARLAAAPALELAMIRYKSGIEFDSVDGKPIQLAFGVIGPPAATGAHVKLLARIARLVKTPGATDTLLAAADLDAFRAALGS